LVENSRYITLSRVSLALALISWFLMGVIPVGIELAAVVTAVISLAGLNRNERKKQRVAWIAPIIGLLKLVATVGLFLWVILAFWLNPVAH
jgi:sorbitol-specific phosphotransferase system component IIC